MVKEAAVLVVAVVPTVVIAVVKIITAAGASCNYIRKWQAAPGSLYLFISFAVVAPLNPKHPTIGA